MKKNKILLATLSLGLIFLGTSKAYAAEDYIKEPNNSATPTSYGGQELDLSWNKNEIQKESNKLSINNDYRLEASLVTSNIGEDSNAISTESQSKDHQELDDNDKASTKVEKPEENEKSNDTKPVESTDQVDKDGDSHTTVNEEGDEPDTNPTDTSDGQQTENIEDWPIISGEVGGSTGPKGEVYPKGTSIEIKKVSKEEKSQAKLDNRAKANTEAGANPKTGILSSTSLLAMLTAASAAYKTSKDQQ